MPVGQGLWQKEGEHNGLERGVIYNGLCCYCGSCGAFCKEYITYENEIPITKKKCHEIYGACYDFAAEFADLSVGSIGSELGWSTVIMRSKVGVEIVKKAKAAGAIETKKLSKEQVKEVRRLASFKKRGNLKHIYDKTDTVRIRNLLVELEMLEGFLGEE